ncbi:MAG: DUF3459 domain-containing protein, partial [Acidimicrobiales bacterium]
FERSRLDWAEMEVAPHAGLLDWYRRLIALRGRIVGLSDGRRDLVSVDFDESEGWMVVHRQGVGVVVNLSDRRATVACTGAVVMLECSDPSGRVVADGVELDADSIAVVSTSAPFSGG